MVLLQKDLKPMNNQYLNQVRIIQIEISSMCNALCLGCIRTDEKNFSQVSPDVPKKVVMDIDIFESIIKDPYFKNTPGRTVDFCGTVDDPLMHPKWLEILELCVRHNVDRVDIHTNAGTRSTDDWREMRKLLEKISNQSDPDYKSLVRFNIDGLEDTNHLYRQHVNWHKVIENATAFLENNGGQFARWQMLEFPWNKHQINQVKELAYKMGFESFTVRHDRSSIAREGLDLNDIRKLQKNYNKRDEHNETIANKTRSEIKKYAQLHEINQDISCHFQKERMIFVDYDARVWPCCFFRNTKLSGSAKKAKAMYSQISDQMYKKYQDWNWNRLDLHSLTKIMQHDYYQSDLTTSWQNKLPDIKDFNLESWKDFQSTSNYSFGCKPFKCVQTCGKKNQKVMTVGKHQRQRLWKYYTDGRPREDLMFKNK